jgi:MoaA/NifB/PqqE/SkfB family radical SAM enzyme
VATQTSSVANANTRHDASTDIPRNPAVSPETRQRGARTQPRPPEASAMKDAPFSAPQLLAVNWMITYQCTRQCSYCLTSSGAAGEELELEDKQRAVRILAALGVRRISIMGGEPFLVRGVESVLCTAHLSGITTNLTTAGDASISRVLHAAHQGIQYLNVSLDGPADVHDRIRGKGGYLSALAAVDAARAEHVPIRLYSVLTRDNCTAANIDWLFETAKNYAVHCLFFIFFSPTGRGRAHPDLRIPLDQRPGILDAIARRSVDYGVPVKDCDPYEPEMFKVFLCPDGSLHTHVGGGVREPLGHVFEEPVGAFWLRLAPADREEHWKSFRNLLERPAGQVGPAFPVPGNRAPKGSQ